MRYVILSWLTTGAVRLGGRMSACVFSSSGSSLVAKVIATFTKSFWHMISRPE